MRILIVEDEIRIREGIQKLLHKTDPEFEIAGEANNGREGIRDGAVSAKALKS